MVQAQEIKIDIKVAGYTEADVKVALDQFRRNCQPLGGEFWGDVTEVRVDVFKEFAPHRIARGWKNTMSLMIAYSDNPKFGPSFASGAGRLAGYTLHFDLGGGETPGFFASKRSSQYLCGLSYSDKGEDLFVAVPGLKFLDK